MQSRARPPIALMNTHSLLQQMLLSFHGSALVSVITAIRTSGAPGSLGAKKVAAAATTRQIHKVISITATQYHHHYLSTSPHLSPRCVHARFAPDVRQNYRHHSGVFDQTRTLFETARQFLK